MTQTRIIHPQQAKRDSEAQRAADERKRRAEQELDGQALDWVVADERGRRFLRRVLFRLTRSRGLEFTPNASLMANELGRHQVGREIEGWLLDRCPQAFLQLLDEQKEDDTSAANSRNDHQRS